MQLLEERILRDGRVYPGNVLKVGGFLNHLIDERLLDEIGKEIAARFCEQNVTKIMTIEASGIAIACAAAHYMHAPVLFAKKSKTSNVSSDCFSAQATREHNDANVLVMGARVIGPGLACQITDTWLDTPFSEEDRHINRLKKLEANVSE